MVETDQLPSITYQDGDSERVIYTLPPTSSPERESVLYFTVPKAGTVMLSKLLSLLAPEVGLRWVYVVGELFQLGILPENAPASTARIVRPKGYCYGFPGATEAFEIPILGKVRTILLVRDPRDMLVSLYYSSLVSHPTPGQSVDAIKDKATDLVGRNVAETTDIDSFAVQVEYSQKYYRNILARYRAMAALPQVKVFRYEDVIYDKQQWAAAICEHYGWDIPTDKQKAAVEQIDVFPDAERPADHVRQVHPGNYEKKLRAETIRWIEEACGEEMAFFGYECPARL
jgi:hypothetical protein